VEALLKLATALLYVLKLMMPSGRLLLMTLTAVAVVVTTAVVAVVSGTGHRLGRQQCGMK
jgi:hypothetical protein